MAIYLQRVSEASIYQSFETSMITAVIGARRVGKTTMVEEYARLHQEYKWVFLNLDHRSQRLGIKNEKLVQMIEEIAEIKLGGDEKIWVVIDEAQKSEEVFDQVKIIYDKYKDRNKIKFILTGSGQLTLRQQCAETLAGRIEIFDLREFNLHEAALIKRPDLSLPKYSILDAIFTGEDPVHINQLISELAPLRRVYEEAIKDELVWGGLPECLAKDTKDNRITYLGNYIDTYFEKDIRMLSTISDLDLYQRLMQITAEQTGSVRDDQKILDALGCSRDTLKKYRGYLHATMMYQEIYPYIGNTMKRIVKSPKGYLMNNGLISYFSGVYDINILEHTGLVGHRFENLVLKQLQINLDQDPKESKIYYYHTHGGFEIDFVIEKMPYVFPIEVTYGKKPKNKKNKNLRQFIEDEKNIKYGIYVYNGDFNFDSENKIIYLPAWALI